MLSCGPVAPEWTDNRCPAYTGQAPQVTFPDPAVWGGSYLGIERIYLGEQTCKGERARRRGGFRRGDHLLQSQRRKLNLLCLLFSRD